MKLYLKIKRPDGKRFNFLDPVTRMFNYKKVVFLYNDKATEVEKEFAEQLLERDPHLVSTKPYEKKEDPQLIRLAEIKKEAEKSQIKHNPETTEQRTIANARFKRSTNKMVQPPKDPGLDQKAEEDAISNKVIEEMEDDPLQYVEILAQISELDRSTMTIDAIRHFGKLVNCKFPKKAGRGKAPLLKQLDARCDELTKKIEKYMNKGPEKYADAATSHSEHVGDHEPTGGPEGPVALPETGQVPEDKEADLIEAGLENTEEVEK